MKRKNRVVGDSGFRGGRRRKKVNLVFVLVIAFALFVCMSGASATTYYVPDDYAKIQWAVDNASAGDTIIVGDGIYHENVNVNKRLAIN